MGTTTRSPRSSSRSALAARSAESRSGDRVLVVVQLLGGNDGLNTVVPHGLDGYKRGTAGSCGCPRRQIHKMTPEIGLHPAMSGHWRSCSRRAAGGGAGGRLSEPRSLALPLDGDLGNRPKLENDASARDRLARPCPRRPRREGRRRPARPAHRHPLPPAGAARPSGPRFPALDSLEQYRLKIAGTDQERTMTRTARARPDRPGRAAERRPLARLPPPQHADGLRIEPAVWNRSPRSRPATDPSTRNTAWLAVWS